ncbi:MAG: hypothetical protein IKF35_03920 [Solobacterium sp.]|nr:hypothetical protein [Solobacterium sp.]
MYRVLVYNTHEGEMQRLKEMLNPAAGYEIVVCSSAKDFLRPETYGGIDAVLDGNPNLKLTEEYFAMLEELGINKLVLRMTGVGQVDFTAASEHGVEIANVQNYDPNVIAELTVALAMGLNRNLFAIADHVRQKDFRIDFPYFREIRDLTVGVLGVGHIGSLSAKYFAAMGARVIGWDKNPFEPNREFMTYVNLENVRREADIILVHLPFVKDENYHLIGREFLRGVKKDVIIVNAARGELVDLAAINEAVREDRIRAYGTDVIEKEQFVNGRCGEEITDPDVLEAVSLYPRIIFTPHVGAYSERAKTAMIEIAAQGIIDFLAGKTPRYCLNPRKK